MEPLTLAEIEVILHALGECEWWTRQDTVTALRRKLRAERERLVMDRL